MVLIPHLVSQVHVWHHLPPRFRNFLNEAVKGHHPFALCQQLLDCDDKCIFVGSVKHERPSLQQMAKWRNLPGVVHWGLHVVLPSVHGINEGLLSLSVPLVLLSCPRVCLLDVSRLFGLKLRHFAPVWSCHRDSLTRWRLAIAQEAARVIFFCVFSIVP